MAAFGNSNRQNNPPQTAVRTSHAIQLKANGVVIGLIKTWAPKQSKKVDPVYELNIDTSGTPYENLPGNVEGLSITVDRYDIWTKRMEEAFGTPDLTNLASQRAPITVEEYWTKPDGTVEVLLYEGVWFKSIGRSYASDDARVVQVNAELIYVRCTKVQ